MVRNKTRFVINVDGGPRTVFSVVESKAGDLYIHITKGGKSYKTESMDELVVIPEGVAFEPCSMHVSIHPSAQSDETNTVKWTKTFSTREETVHQLTTGIKKDNLFVPALFRICGDLSAARYSVKTKPKETRVSLGEYDPRKGQLRFMAICSRTDKTFQKIDDHPSNLMQYVFTNFTLTLIWSYLNLPSHPQAIDFFLGAKNEGASPIGGFDEAGIYNMYTSLYMTHADEYLRIYGEDGYSAKK